jgi:hypothetical protein
MFLFLEFLLREMALRHGHAQHCTFHPNHISRYRKEPSNEPIVVMIAMPSYRGSNAEHVTQILTSYFPRLSVQDKTHFLPLVHDGQIDRRMIPLLSRSQYLSYRETPHGGPVRQAKFGRNMCSGVDYCLVLEWLYSDFGLVIRFVEHLNTQLVTTSNYTL